MVDTFRLTPFLDKFENKSTKHPKVSIILPARNEEEFLGKCLDSLENQDYDNYEIVVIDDSSEDRTKEIILEHAEKSSKIVPISAKNKTRRMDGEKLGMHGRLPKKHLQRTFCYLPMQIQLMQKMSSHWQWSISIHLNWMHYQ